MQHRSFCSGLKKPVRKHILGPRRVSTKLPNKRSKIVIVWFGMECETAQVVKHLPKFTRKVVTQLIYIALHVEGHVGTRNFTV